MCFIIVPGNWTEWSEWSSCSLTCGGGIQTRTRDCDISWIQGLTAPCEGDDSEETACHEFACDTGKGGYRHGVIAIYQCVINSRSLLYDGNEKV